MNLIVYSVRCSIFDKMPPELEVKWKCLRALESAVSVTREESFLCSVLLTRSKLSIINCLYRWKNAWLMQVTVVARNLLYKRIANVKKSQDLLLAMRTLEYSEYVFCKSPLITRVYLSVIHVCIYIFWQKEINIIQGLISYLFIYFFFFIYSYISKIAH